MRRNLGKGKRGGTEGLRSCHANKREIENKLWDLTTAGKPGTVITLASGNKEEFPTSIIINTVNRILI